MTLREQRIRVADPGLLSGLIREVGAQHPTQAAAADALGISRGHYSRLLRHDRVGTFISRKLFNRLVERVPEHRGDDVQRALVSPGTAQLLLQFERQLSKQLERYGIGELASLARHLEFSPVLGPIIRSMLTGEHAIQVWAPRAPAVWRTLQEISAHEPYRELVADFLAGCERRGHAVYGRVLLSVARVIDPLVPTADGMELSWKDLHASGKLKAYLRRALANEALLLDRAPDLQRAQQIAAEQERFGVPAPPRSQPKAKESSRGRKRR